jgi:mono/diheme cytochrome c family protein
MAAASMGIISLGLVIACVPASEPARAADEPATPAPAAAAPKAPNEALRAKGRELFSNWGCIACHTLADAGGHGDVGPSLDGGTRLTKDYVARMVANGQGAMPAFGGQMTEEEIADLAAYIEAFKK